MRLSIFSLVLLWPQTVFADDPAYQPWSASGDWEILVDAAVGNGCFMQKDFADGLRVRFGNHPMKSGRFFSILNRAWEQLEPGDTGVLKFFLDNERFAGDAEVIEEGPWKGGYAFFNNPNLSVEFAKSRNLTLVPPSGNEYSIDLNGTFRAVRRLEECQKQQDAANE